MSRSKDFFEDAKAGEDDLASKKKQLLKHSLVEEMGLTFKELLIDNPAAAKHKRSDSGTWQAKNLLDRVNITESNQIDEESVDDQTSSNESRSDDSQAAQREGAGDEEEQDGEEKKDGPKEDTVHALPEEQDSASKSKTKSTGKLRRKTYVGTMGFYNPSSKQVVLHLKNKIMQKMNSHLLQNSSVSSQKLHLTSQNSEWDHTAIKTADDATKIHHNRGR